MKIDKNIPIFPKRFGLNKKSSTYDFICGFKKMEIGDSFLAECEDNHNSYNNKRSLILHSIAEYNRYNTKKIKITTRISKKEKGIRVWRLK